MPTKIVFGNIGQDMPAMYFGGSTSETVVPGASSATTTMTANATHNVACVVSTDTAIHVAFGPAPTASASNGVLVPSGAMAYFRIAPGDKAAFITA